jgi:alpha-D-xyloside xylohydrolase
MYKLSPGVKFYPSVHFYEYSPGEDAVTIVGLYTEGMHATKIAGRVIRVEVTSPLAGVLRIRAAHFGNLTEPAPGFLTSRPLKLPLVVTDSEEALRVESGGLQVEFSKSCWGIRFQTRSGVLCESGRDGLGFIEREDGSHHMTEKLGLRPGECVYGLGERFAPFVRNGQSVRMWNTDAATVSDLAYKNIPFYVSSGGYGVLVNTPAMAEFEIATEDNSAVRFTVPGHELDYLVISGISPREILGRYVGLTGKPPLIPKWSLGLWLTTSFTTVYDEKTIMEQVEGMKLRGIPLSVFHFDCYWMRERHWCDFRWDTAAFPDPEGMIRRLKNLGLKICVWINPYISELSDIYPEGAGKGFFLKKRCGDVYQVDMWQPGIAFVDFTNPEARKWYCSKLRVLLDMGVDTFKTDFGEAIPDDAVYFDGTAGGKMHNLYTLLYNQCVFELLEERRGKGEALVFARSATAGSQRYPVHWGGDSSCTYQSMAAELRGGLSFAMSGGAFWSHDIGGFYGMPTPDLYKRWVAFGLLSSHSRLHGDSSYRVPWNFDEESVAVLKHFTRLRHSLIPYLYTYCQAAHETGIPLMRPMVMEFPEDPTCRYLDRQYMLGDELLVAPVFQSDGGVEYYLPQGMWSDFEKGTTVEGGRWFKAEHGYFSLPFFVRENAIIPVGPVESAFTGSSFESLTLRVYHLEGKGSFRLFDKGRMVEIYAEKSDSEYRVRLTQPIDGARIVFMGIPGLKEVKGDAELVKADGNIPTVRISGRSFSAR